MYLDTLGKWKYTCLFLTDNLFIKICLRNLKYWFSWRFHVSFQYVHLLFHGARLIRSPAPAKHAAACFSEKLSSAAVILWLSCSRLVRIGEHRTIPSHWSVTTHRTRDKNPKDLHHGNVAFISTAYCIIHLYDRSNSLADSYWDNPVSFPQVWTPTCCKMKCSFSFAMSLSFTHFEVFEDIRRP